MERVMMAMSGGVDSTAALVLTKERFSSVSGGTLILTDLPGAREGAAEAQRAAEKMGVEHYTFDARTQFKARVQDYLAAEYMAGRTPNPCVKCNMTVKFPVFMDFAARKGYNTIATGHYARVERDSATGRYLLKKGVDPKKDQSYFLYGLSQDVLSRVVFPIGHLTKEQVKELAFKMGLTSANRPESQDVCFLPDGDHRRFIEENYGAEPEEGDFTDLTGKVLGKHTGALGYTVGQRRGLGVSAETRLYVIKKDMERNTVTLGQEKDLYTRYVLVDNINTVAVDSLTDGMELSVKLRYSPREERARVIITGEDSCMLEFLSPQRWAAPGQSAVMYHGDVVVAGGIITGTK